MKSELFLLAAALLCIAAVLEFHVLHHELAHCSVYKRWGISCSVKASLFSGKAVPNEKELEEACSDEEACRDIKILNAINDLIGYNVSIPLILTNCLLALACILLIVKK